MGSRVGGVGAKGLRGNFNLVPQSLGVGIKEKGKEREERERERKNGKERESARA